jgi:3-dehydroquinate synthase
VLFRSLGHTFGRAIETGMGYGVWLHGEGVSAGTLLAADLSLRMGLLSRAEVARIAALFQRAGLPVTAPGLGYDAYMNYMGVDKKVEAGRIRFVLLRGLGKAFVSGDYDAAALHATLTEAVAQA